LHPSRNSAAWWLLRKEQGATTLHLPGVELRLDHSTRVVSATRYYAFGGRTVAERTNQGVSFQVSDQHGTGMSDINATTGAITWRRSTPYQLLDDRDQLPQQQRHDEELDHRPGRVQPVEQRGGHRRRGQGDDEGHRARGGPLQNFNPGMDFGGFDDKYFGELAPAGLAKNYTLRGTITREVTFTLGSGSSSSTAPPAPGRTQDENRCRNQCYN
jgi:hypothetical protein